MLSSPLLPALWLPRAAQRLLRHPLDMGLLGIRVQAHTPSGVCVLFTLSLCFALARSVCLSRALEALTLVLVPGDRLVAHPLVCLPKT